MPAAPRPRRAHAVRAGTAALALVLSAGCRDSGLPGRNTPVEEAMRRASRYPVYETADPVTDPSATAFVMGGERWQTTGLPERVPQRLLKTVGGAEGMQLYALSWDDTPYSRLWVAGPSGSLRLLARAQ